MKLVILLLAGVPLFSSTGLTPNGEIGNDSVLTTSSTILPLSEVAGIQNLNLHPGVRGTYVDKSLSISSHDGSNLVFVTPNGKIVLPSPALAMPSEAGWTIVGTSFSSSDPIVARLKTQDDTDNNLKSMQESAKKLKAKNNGQEGNKSSQRKSHMRFLYGSSNPMGTSEAFSQAAIQQLTHLSAIGF
jgi:hypothetical protein